MSHARGPTRQLICALILSIGVGLSVTACGGGDPDSGASPSPSASTSTPLSPSSAVSESPSDSASESSSSAAAGVAQPASGPPAQLTSLSFDLPQGWQLQAKSDVEVSGFDPTSSTGSGGVLVTDSPGFPDDTLDSEAKIELQQNKGDGLTVTRGADRTVNGVEGYVITGRSGSAPIFYEFGTVTNGRDVVVMIQYAAKTDTAPATIESILASIAWQ